MAIQLSLVFISFSIFVILKLLDIFLNGNVWFWEYYVFIPEYFFTIAGLVLLVLSLIKRERKEIIVSILLLLLTILNLPLVSLGQPDQTSNESIKVLVYNKGFWQEMDYNMAEFFSNQDVDLILIQEAVEQDKVDEMLTYLNGWDYKRGYDLVTFSRFPIVNNEVGKGRFLKTTIKIGAKEVEVYNVHLPFPLYSSGAGGLWDIFNIRQDHYTELYNQLKENEKCKIIAGDFNTKSNSNLLKEMFSNYNDAAQAKGGYPLTWNSLLPVFRVDYIFSSKEVVPVEYESFIRLSSDHYVVKSKLIGLENCK